MTSRKPRVWFTKAVPGHGETARWIIKLGPTKRAAEPVGFTTCRPGIGRTSGGYWQGYLLPTGREVTVKPVLTRQAAANAVVLRWQEQQ